MLICILFSNICIKSVIFTNQINSGHRVTKSIQIKSSSKANHQKVICFKSPNLRRFESCLICHNTAIRFVSGKSAFVVNAFSFKFKHYLWHKTGHPAANRIFACKFGPNDIRINLGEEHPTPIKLKLMLKVENYC